jgi:2-C-methyl-D-erythritol 4-phosphate cytidylyltransferase / 2-C-methyl-D-erythritol 2,4-cyclodiphosphate synthase
VQAMALIVAAGRGLRARDGSQTRPKQYARIAGGSVIGHAAGPFLRHDGIAGVLVVVHPDDVLHYQDAFSDAHPKLLQPCFGGPTRQDSVRFGLERLAADHAPEAVLIHDCARPFVDCGIIDRVLDALSTVSAAIPVLSVTDTLKHFDPSSKAVRTLSRDNLWRAQTPQGFRFGDILAAHRAAAAAGRGDFTDDAAVAEWHGIDVSLVPGSEANHKLTTSEDLIMAAGDANPGTADVRTGTGFDVHRLVPGDAVWLCGIEIAHTHGLEGHSDADVGLHALTDALLGAIGDGDIGQHFPPTDERWRGAPSHLFLADAARRVAARGGRIGNVDVTLLCEAPKVAPHRQAMRERIAQVLGIGVDRVGVKATTTEGLGFTGRREGIAALATATVTILSA